MQPQRREVRVENDEYERAAAPSETNKARSRLEKRPYLRAFCAVQKRAHNLALFQPNAYALPFFSHFSHFVAHA